MTAAVVLALDGSGGEAALTAFVAASAAGVTPAEPAEPCQRSMPAYMVPKAFLFLDERPLSANGKADRTALTALATADVTGR